MGNQMTNRSTKGTTPTGMVMTWLLMLAVMIGSSPAAHAELLIRITEGADSAIPVAGRWVVFACPKPSLRVIQCAE